MDTSLIDILIDIMTRHATIKITSMEMMKESIPAQLLYDALHILLLLCQEETSCRIVREKRGKGNIICIIM